MQLNALHMRLGAIAAGILLVGFFIVSGGSFGDENVIQLDFSLYPEDFEGSGVEIDGELVGTLERFGQAMRSGFEVSPGEHAVRIAHPRFDCDPIRVRLERPGEKIRIMLDFESRQNPDHGRPRTMIAMNR